jgi:hypothetical protein
MLPICRNYKDGRLRQIGTTGNLRGADMLAALLVYPLTLRSPHRGRLEGRGPAAAAGPFILRDGRNAASSG